jgi:hypothetical protein
MALSTPNGGILRVDKTNNRENFGRVNRETEPILLLKTLTCGMRL